MKNKIAIIGSGAMGTALAKVLSYHKDFEIVIYGIDEEELESLKKGKNLKYFPESVKFPHFKTTNDLDEVLKNATHVIMAVPSKTMDIVFKKVLEKLTTNVIVVNAAKGFYPNTSKSLHIGMQEEAKGNSFVRGIVSLIGPSHAEEIVLDLPTVVAVVDKDKKLCQEVQEIFATPYFKTYIQTDVKGSEVGAAYKNVLAIATGISAGLGYGVNTQAALLTRGIAEMLRFNKIMGGKSETIMGLTGIGDLIVTATSDLSRNFTFGKKFVKEGVKALESNTTVEGVIALKEIQKISKAKKIYLPIVNLLYKAIFEKQDLHKIIDLLWAKELKEE